MEKMKSLTKHIAEIKKRRDERPKEIALSFGQQDAMDLISYAGMEEQADYIHLDDQYVRIMSITGYPYNAQIGWLNNLINFNHNAEISFQIELVDSALALKKLTRKITELESTKRQIIKSGGIVGPEVEDPLNSATSLRNGIQRGQQKLFQVSIYVALITNTREELEDVTKILESSLASQLFFTKVAKYKQLEALQSVLPRAQNFLGNKRDLDSNTTALAFPYVSSELVQESGILYGVNKSNNSLVILDRFSLNNANSIVFAQSGSGKSYASKVEILRQLVQGTQVIVIDPEREYEGLAKAVGGTYINLSATSKQKINPFDLATTAHTKEQLSEHAQDLIEIIARMVANPDQKDKTPALTAEERAGVDKVILKLYRKAKNKPPSLREFRAEMERNGFITLAKKLDKYLDGTLEGIFNQETNIELNNRLVVFDIKDLQESVRQPMMMVVSTFVKNKVMAHPEKRLLVIDEGWILMQDEESARFVSGLVRRARKYYLGVSIISQQANDFLNNKYGRAIASQSALRILMRQDTTTIKNVASEFNLSAYERSYLLTCDKGDALIIADQHHVALHITASQEEHPLITTDPAEIYKS